MGKGKKNMRNVRRGRAMKRPIEDKTPEWVININNCLKEGPDYDSGRSWTIYRVPQNMREVYRNAYVPKIISVGPCHYEEQGRQVMEEHKMRYLLRLLGGRLQENGEQALPQVCNGSHLEDVEQAEEPVPKVRKVICLEDLVGAMRELEQKTRDRYSEAFDINSDDFVQMMVVDGCFVVELLRLYHKFDKEEDVDDPIFTTRWMLRTLQRDLLMLENQLPFFVLEELFKLTSLVEEPSLVELTLKFFDPLLPRENTPQPNPKIKFDHMLHVFRSTFLSSVKDETSALVWRQLQTSASIPLVRERQLIHCVKELQEAGVKLKKREDRQLLDINFEGRVLDIPPLYIDANTVPLLLNFVAYEQCDQKAKPFFTNFFMFFDSLINTAKDVEILHKNGIINHALGSDKDVASLFNKLCKEIVYDLDECYLSRQMKGVNDYCKAYYATKWHVWWTNLIRDYFSSPWTFLSLVAAITLLILTVTQTAYDVRGYYHSSSDAHPQ
ncbi:hypothetical protein L1049_000395 [Liquidambar formosana]|uniref:Uncharacterized protein n=1 Tax=Liquidambar formosana TaxID=63359 RepID=A0AAP0N8Q5_LIQFO